jgi:hypothetical protein
MSLRRDQRTAEIELLLDREDKMNRRALRERRKEPGRLDYHGATGPIID